MYALDTATGRLLGPYHRIFRRLQPGGGGTVYVGSDNENVLLDTGS